MTEDQRDKFRTDFVYGLHQYIGIPYRWGGKLRKTGLDCSGFVQMVLAKIGVMPAAPAMSSAGQFDWFRTRDLIHKGYDDLMLPGNILFWGNDSGIHHVSFFFGRSADSTDFVLDCGRGRQRIVTYAGSYFEKAGVQIRQAWELGQLYSIQGIVDIVEAWEQR
jgi:cell wall-associated NlpC family hydrolase